MIDRVHRVFFVLLQSGLWDKNIDSIDLFPLSEEEWSSLMALSVGQAVEAVVYDGILKLDEGIFPPKEIMLKWVARVDAIERRNSWMENIIAETTNLFAEEGIACMLLKGHGVAICYRQPWHRNSGDVDYYFSDELSFKKANKAILDQGINLEAGTLYSAYYHWRWCEIEHHTTMIDIMNPFKRKYLRRLEIEEKARQVKIDVERGAFVTPSPLLMHVQLNAHILKHFLGFGVGLRQFCDVARLCYYYRGQIDGEKLREVYKKLDIYPWIQAVHYLLVTELGLEERFLPFPLDESNVEKWLIRDVLEAGNFGFYDQRFAEEDRAIEHRERDHKISRVLPHLIRAMKYAPSEVFWFPWQKVYSAISRKRVV